MTRETLAPTRVRQLDPAGAGRRAGEVNRGDEHGAGDRLRRTRIATAYARAAPL